MLLEITQALTSVKNISDLLKLISNTKTELAVQEKALELFSAVTTLQSKLAEAQMEYSNLLEEKEKFRSLALAAEDWKETSQKYELAELAVGLYAYRLKMKYIATEPGHWLCPACFEKKQKGILQRGARNVNGQFYICALCQTPTIDVSNAVNPTYAVA